MTPHRDPFGGLAMWLLFSLIGAVPGLLIFGFLSLEHWWKQWRKPKDD